MQHYIILAIFKGFPSGTSGKAPTCQCRRYKRRGFNPWVRKIPWRRAWQLTPVFLPREIHGQKSLVGYSPWGCKGLDLIEQLSMLLGCRLNSYEWQRSSVNRAYTLKRLRSYCVCTFGSSNSSYKKCDYSHGVNFREVMWRMILKPTGKEREAKLSKCPSMGAACE